MISQNSLQNRKKTFAVILDAANLILKAIEFSSKIRGAVDALIGVAGGRKEFSCAHLNLFRRISIGREKEISNDGKRRCVQRFLDDIEAEQTRVGKVIFTITRGGGAERKPTEYIDHLTELATLAELNTQERMTNENIKPARFKIILQEEAVKLSRLLPDTPKAKKELFTLPIDDEAYIQGECTRSLNCFERALIIWLKKGGDSEDFLIRHYDRLKKRTEDVNAKTSETDDNDVQDAPETGEPSNKLTRISKPNMLEEALSLASRGFRIFPVHCPNQDGCSCKKKHDCRSIGKHPRINAWQKAATTDKTQIKLWWEKWSDANIGIATGSGSNVIVLDVDTNKGGDVGLAALFDGIDIPDTLSSKTGNGFHFFFQCIDGVEIKGSVSTVAEGLDIRGENGFVVAAPSLHRNGNRYAWINDEKPCPLPDFLKNRLLEIEAKRSSDSSVQKTEQTLNIKNSITDTSVIPESTRNDSLFRKAASLRGKGAGESEILEKLREINQTACVPALDDDEVQTIVRSVMRYATNQEKNHRA